MPELSDAKKLKCKFQGSGSKAASKRAARPALQKRAAGKQEEQGAEGLFEDEDDDIKPTREELAAASRHLWLGNLAGRPSQRDIYELFSPFGEVEVAYKPGNLYGFADYRQKEAAVRALKVLGGKHIPHITGDLLLVIDYSITAHESDEEDEAAAYPAPEAGLAGLAGSVKAGSGGSSMRWADYPPDSPPPGHHAGRGPGRAVAAASAAPRHAPPGTAFGARSVFERYGEFQPGGYQHSQHHDGAVAAGSRRSATQQLREDSAADYLARRDAALARRAQREAAEQQRAQQEAAEQRAQYELRKQQLALATKQAEQELMLAHSAHSVHSGGGAGIGDAAAAGAAAPAGQGLAGNGQRTQSPPAAGTAAGQQRPDVGAKLLQAMRVARRAETAVLHAEHAATSAGEGGVAQDAQRGEGSSHSAEVQAQAPPPSSAKQPTPAGAAATASQAAQARPPSSEAQALAAAPHAKQPTPAAGAAATVAASQGPAAATAAAAGPPGLAASAGQQVAERHYHTEPLLSSVDLPGCTDLPAAVGRLQAAVENLVKEGEQGWLAKRTVLGLMLRAGLSTWEGAVPPGMGRWVQRGVHVPSLGSKFKALWETDEELYAQYHAFGKSLQKVFAAVSPPNLLTVAEVRKGHWLALLHIDRLLALVKEQHGEEAAAGGEGRPSRHLRLRNLVPTASQRVLFQHAAKYGWVQGCYFDFGRRQGNVHFETAAAAGRMRAALDGKVVPQLSGTVPLEVHFKHSSSPQDDISVPRPRPDSRFAAAGAPGPPPSAAARPASAGGAAAGAAGAAAAGTGSKLEGPAPPAEAPGPGHAASSSAAAVNGAVPAAAAAASESAAGAASKTAGTETGAARVVPDAAGPAPQHSRRTSPIKYVPLPLPPLPAKARSPVKPQRAQQTAAGGAQQQAQHAAGGSIPQQAQQAVVAGGDEQQGLAGGAAEGVAAPAGAATSPVSPAPAVSDGGGIEEVAPAAPAAQPGEGRGREEPLDEEAVMEGGRLAVVEQVAAGSEARPAGGQPAVSTPAVDKEQAARQPGMNTQGSGKGPACAAGELEAAQQQQDEEREVAGGDSEPVPVTGSAAAVEAGSAAGAAAGGGTAAEEPSQSEQPMAPEVGLAAAAAAEEQASAVAAESTTTAAADTAAAAAAAADGGSAGAAPMTRAPAEGTATPPASGGAADLQLSGAGEQQAALSQAPAGAEAGGEDGATACARVEGSGAAIPGCRVGAGGEPAVGAGMLETGVPAGRQPAASEQQRAVAAAAEGGGEERVACCANCGATDVKLKKCSACQAVSYCGVDCQAADWTRRHHADCHQLRHLKQLLSSATNEEQQQACAEVLLAALREPQSAVARAVRTITATALGGV